MENEVRKEKSINKETHYMIVFIVDNPYICLTQQKKNHFRKLPNA